RLHQRLERLGQQKALQREQARLASVLEATSDFVGFADAEGRVLYVNRAGRRMVGRGEDEDIRELRITDLHPRWAAERVQTEGIPEALAHGLWSGDAALVHKDGRELPVSQVIAAHRAADGSV